MIYLKKQSLWTKSFLGICISNFFLFMTFYSLMATLPMFVIDGLKGSGQQAGLAMTVFLIGSVMFRPLAGKWVDEYGRKKILFISLTLFLAASIMYVEVNNLLGLLSLRFIHGVAFAIANTTLSAVATDLIPEQRKGEGIGYFATFMSMAMVIGPFLGLTLIAHYNFKIFFIMCAIFAVISFLCGNLTHIPKATAKRKIETNKILALKSFIEPSAITISFVSALASFAYAGISTFSSIYAKQIGVGKFASYFFVSYAVTLVLSRPFVGRIFDRLGSNIVIYPAIFVFIIGLSGLSQAKGPFIFLVAGAIIGLGSGTLFSTLQTIAVTSSPSHRRGVVTSTYFLFYDMGIGVGAFILGIVAAHTSYSAMYLFSAVIVLCSAITYYTFYHRKSNKKDYDMGQLAEAQ